MNSSTLFIASYTVFTNTMLVICGNVYTPQFLVHAFSFKKILFTKKKLQQYRKSYFPNKFTKT
jgi:hypothetical protein